MEVDIVMVTHVFPPYIGGLSHVVENISVNLSKMGFRVEVVTLDTSGSLPGEEVYEGVLVKRFKGWAPSGVYYIPSPGFIDYIKKVKCRVIHIHNIGSISTFTALYVLRNRRDCRKILTPHYHESGSTWHTRFLWRIYRPLVKSLIRKIDIVHSVSRYEQELIKGHFNVDSVLIPNGILEDVFNYTWSKPVDQIILTYAGRVEGYKNIDKLIQATSRLVKLIRKPIRVKIIGSGRALDRVIELSRSLGVDIVHYSFLPRNRYLRELSETTVFVNLSRYEAYSIVTAEALAMGIPVVISRSWGSIFRDFDRVILVDPGSREEVVKAIHRAIEIAEVSKPSGEKRFFKTWREVTSEIVGKLYGLGKQE